MKLFLAGVAAAAVCIGTIGPASAAPLMAPPLAGAGGLLIEQARITCQENGWCSRPLRRRPVAKWVYGDTIFYPQYVGPGYYGNPRYHRNWWPWW